MIWFVCFCALDICYGQHLKKSITLHFRYQLNEPKVYVFHMFVNIDIYVSKLH